MVNKIKFNNDECQSLRDATAKKFLTKRADLALSFEPPRGKTNNVVSEQVRHKPGYTSTEKS